MDMFYVETQTRCARGFERFGRILLTRTWKVIVLLFTLALITVGTIGLTHLRMEFKPEWLMDPESESNLFLTLSINEFSCNISDLIYLIFV